MTQNTYGYSDLTAFGWRPGVYRAPSGYEHPWLVVTQAGTGGYWTRVDAREAYRRSARAAELQVRGINLDDAAQQAEDECYARCVSRGWMSTP